VSVWQPLAREAPPAAESDSVTGFSGVHNLRGTGSGIFGTEGQWSVKIIGSFEEHDFDRLCAAPFFSNCSLSSRQCGERRRRATWIVVIALRRDIKCNFLGSETFQNLTGTAGGSSSS